MSDSRETPPTPSSEATLSFNRAVKVTGSDQRLSSDAGALLLREFDERLRFVPTLAKQLVDPRHPDLIEYSLTELLRARIFLIAQGWTGQIDANVLREDPALCIATADQQGEGAIGRQLASQSTQSRLVDVLRLPANRRAMRWAVTDLSIRARSVLQEGPLETFTLDLDSSDHETHGHQEAASYNGHYGHTCYHPLYAYVGETGDLVGAWLRPGTVPSQKGAAAYASAVLDRLEKGKYGLVGHVRGDCAFAVPAFMERLEARNTKYVFRLKTNPVLERLAKPFLTRPVGRPPNHVRTWLYELSYAAGTWSKNRRVVLVVIDDPAKREFFGEPELQHFFLVTSYSAEEKSAADLLEHYRQRATSENWIGEFKNEIAPLLSSPLLSENRVTFMLAAIAFQFLHLLRSVTTKATGRDSRLSLSALRTRVLKVAARFVRGKRRILVQIAAVAWSVWHLVLPCLPPLPPS